MQGEALVRRIASATQSGEFGLRGAPPARLGLRHLDDEPPCRDPAHAGARRALACGHCGRALASPHLLDLHVQEEHDSFFAALAATRPSYCCYVEECPDKFAGPEQRFDHCVKVHNIPKDFRFYQKPKIRKKKYNRNECMDVDSDETKHKLFTLRNSKVKAFVQKYKTTSSNSVDTSAMSVDNCGTARS